MDNEYSGSSSSGSLKFSQSILQSPSLKNRFASTHNPNSNPGYSAKSKTFRESHFIKPGAYYQLGSLGANTGTPEWHLKVKSLNRRVNYAQMVQQANNKLVKIKG